MKANSPPGPSSAEVSMVAGQGTRNRRNSTTSTPDLMTISPTSPSRIGSGFDPQVGDVEAHADGEEEHAEQEPLERVDRRLDGAVILGLGQQQAGNEGAERHRQAGGGGDEPAADGDEQRGGDEQLGRARGGDGAEHRPQQRRADQRDQRR